MLLLLIYLFSIYSWVIIFVVSIITQKLDLFQSSASTLYQSLCGIPFAVIF